MASIIDIMRNIHFKMSLHDIGQEEIFKPNCTTLSWQSCSDRKNVLSFGPVGAVIQLKDCLKWLGNYQGFLHENLGEFGR